MYLRNQLADLNWHPGKDVGRGPNCALAVWGRDPRNGQVRYTMACGHLSVPGFTRCERGCTSAPNYRIPYTFEPHRAALGKYFERHGKAYQKAPEGRKVA